MGARDQVKPGITAPKRVADAPDVPTLKEQGTNAIFVNWRFCPPGMSDSDSRKLLKCCDVQKTPEWEAVRKEMHGLISIILTKSSLNF